MMVVNTSPLSLLRVSTATNEQRLTFLRSTAEADTLLLPRAYRHGSWLMAHAPHRHYFARVGCSFASIRRPITSLNRPLSNHAVASSMNRKSR